MLKLILIVALAYMVSLLNGTYGKRIAQGKIYRGIESKYFCIRRLNATHQFGCQSNFAGNIGVLHYVSNSQSSNDDIKWITSDGPSPPYIPVIDVEFLSTLTMEKFQMSNRVSGVIVINRGNKQLDAFSPESSCPNDGYGLYNSFVNRSYAEYSHCSKQKWNPDNPVLELFYRDFGFPVLMIENPDDIDNIHRCIINYGVTKENPKRSWPLCSAELYIHMNAAKDSKTCIRRNGYSSQLDNTIRYCDPLGSFNVFDPLITIDKNSSVSDKSLIVVASRMDSFSFFYDKTPGADSPVTSITVLLSIAQTLGKIRNQILSRRKNNKNVLFSLFNGEAFDYIGSGRTAFDLKNGIFRAYSTGDLDRLDFPSLSFDHLSSFIELNQLAPHTSNSLWAHIDPISNRNPETASAVSDLFEKLSKPKKIVIMESPKDKPLPPSSFQSFLRENIKIPGVVLANHGNSYTNKYYNSFADDQSNIKFYNNSQSNADIVRHLANISTQISEALYEMLTGETDSSISSDPETIKDLLYCFVINASCPLFAQHGLNTNQASGLEGFPTLPLYVSVHQQYTSAFFLMNVIAQLLSTFTGSILEGVNTEKCLELKAENKWLSYNFIPGPTMKGVCVESQVFATQAVSPVFLSEEPNWDLGYSTWTESIWDQPSVRIFLQPGPTQEWLSLVGGALLTLVFSLVIRFLERRSSVIFKSSSDNEFNLMRDNVDC